MVSVHLFELHNKDEKMIGKCFFRVVCVMSSCSYLKKIYKCEVRVAGSKIGNSSGGSAKR